MAVGRVQSLIEIDSGGVNLNVLVYESGYDVTLGQTANSNPSPAGRMITSTTRTENDKLNIKGWIRCVFCDRVVEDGSDFLARFKAVIERQKYAVSEFATITNNDGVFENMRLASVSWTRNGDLPEQVEVSMSWEQVNISGSISSKTFDMGGLVV